MKKAKKYLQRYRQAKNTIRLNQRLIKTMREQSASDPSVFLQAIDYARDKVQVSPKDSMADKIIKEVDQQDKRKKELEEKNDELEEFCKKVRRQILDMDDCIHYVILWLHYIDGYEFEKVATGIGYSYSRTTHVHGEALEAFEKKYLSGEDSKT